MSPSILFKLPPSPSLVQDIQFNRTLAAILCESCELFLYDLSTFQLVRRITTASQAMALGPRWLAYPGCVGDGLATADASQDELIAAGDDDTKRTGSASSPDDVASVEALMGFNARSRLGSSPSSTASSSLLGSSPSFTAIDVAQNVASGLYYLSGVGRAKLAPYLLSSSPGQSDMSASGQPVKLSSSPFELAASEANAKPKRQSASGSTHAGWVIVQDVVTQQVVCSFQCHATALVNLAFDASGTLLATGSTKGQNLHVYRLAPPLQTVANNKGHHVKKNPDAGCFHHQLLYKLQRGITHASIQDIAFSQDAKWISITSAHGTSHLFAIHPDGARISADTHTNVVESTTTTVVTSSLEESVGELGMPAREVSDFCADLRSFESKTMTQVLKLRHDLKPLATPTPADEIDASQSSPPVPAGGFSRNALMESALDASQALLTQLTNSTALSMDFGGYFDEDADVEARRRRRRRRIGGLFARDGLRLVICCDFSLKLYDLRISPSFKHTKSPTVRGHGRTSRSGSVEDEDLKKSKSSAVSFGFDAQAALLRTLELTGSGIKRESIAASRNGERLPAARSSSRSELRTFAQRSLPLWAHPKITFRAKDADHPDGRVLEVKRKGPTHAGAGLESSGAWSAEGDQQLFVLEMDSYFGVGGSPVFNGHNQTHGGSSQAATAADIPPLDLKASINMAMSTSMERTPPKPDLMGTTPPTGTFSPPQGEPQGKKSKKKRNNRRGGSTPPPEITESPADEGQCNASPTLQFTIQDMYFAAPDDETKA